MEENTTRDLNFSQIITLSSKKNSNSREEIELERNLSCLDEQSKEIIKQTEYIITTQLCKMAKVVQNEIQKDAMREKAKQSDITTDFLFAIAVILFVIAIVRGTSLSL